MLHNQDISWI